MRAIFIAAGMGKRLRPYTDDCPKCMLPLNGKPVIANNVDHLKANGVTDISVVVGYRKEKIYVEDAEVFENPDFRDNNILHSVMCAEEIFERAVAEDRDLVLSYSDIIYSNEIVRRLVARKEDIAIAVDIDWRRQYEGRTDHPLSEAEKVEMKPDSGPAPLALQLGKHVEDDGSSNIAEFTGLLKLSAVGARQWLNHFRAICKRFEATEPFQNAAEFRKAYLCDFLQDLVDSGIPVHCSTFSGGWMEYDTVQDYEKLLANYSSG